MARPPRHWRQRRGDRRRRGLTTTRVYVLADGTAMSVGNNDYGQLGNGGTSGINANTALVAVLDVNLSGASADLTGADLTGANLYGADLTGAVLTGADLSGIRSGNITGTPTLPSGYQMVNGYIIGPGADLSGADLTGADLSDRMHFS